MARPTRLTRKASVNKVASDVSYRPVFQHYLSRNQVPAAYTFMSIDKSNNLWVPKTYTSTLMPTCDTATWHTKSYN
eukprot:scaffold2267_cov162-Amphora_coffeaeformis.AAC.3